MSDPIVVSGEFSDKDLKRQAQQLRTSMIGPTAVYYAGVTAPIISASVSVMVRNAAQMAGFTPYWQWMSAALVAATAGICWYLIFIRWSSHHLHERARALARDVRVSLEEAYLKVVRGGVETRIGWDHVESVRLKRGYVAIQVRGADTFLIPDRWFALEKGARREFIDALKQKVSSHGA